MTRGTGLEDFRSSEATELVPEPELEEAGIKRALVVAAHPDDADFGAGGTAACWVRQGNWEFYYLVCTDGSKGSSDPSMQPERLIKMRREEQREAARILGVKEVFFLDYVDGELTYNREFLGQVVRYIRLLKPYAVFTHDPEPQIIRDSFINHPDHRRTGEVTIDAVYPTARDRLNFPQHLAEGLEPHKVRELYVWGSLTPNFEVDITDLMDLKLQALMAHISQFGEREDFLETARERWRGENGRYVERFRKVTLFR